MLNTIHLQTFLAVVEAGNYTAAAERLHMSQPAVSHQIRTLEKQLGAVRLFRRVGQTMLLTHAGEELLPQARELVAMAERVEASMRSLRGEISGRVLLGCASFGAELLLPALLAIFRSQFAAVTVVVEMVAAEHLAAAIATRSYNLLITEDPLRNREWEDHLLGGEPLALLAPPDHPLLLHEIVTAADLRQQALVLPRSGTAARRNVEEGLRRNGFLIADQNVALETDSLLATLQAVRGGMGLAFVPETCRDIAPDLPVVSLTDLQPRQLWHVARPRVPDRSPAAQKLFAFLIGAEAQAVFTRNGSISAGS